MALRTLAPLLAQAEREELMPPEELSGPARELFAAIVKGNASRPWNASHVPALRDYCRVSVMWDEQMSAVEREGPLIGGDKPHPNPRLRVCSALSAERLRLARLLGIAMNRVGPMLGGSRYTENKLRELGASMAEASAQDVDGFLT